MKKILVMVVAVMVLLVGCSGGGLSFTLQNDTSMYDFIEVNVSPSSSESWGEMLISDTVPSGGTVEIDVAEVAEEGESYDIRILDHEMDAYLYYGVMIEDGGSISIYFGDNGLALDVMDSDGNITSTVEGSLG